MSKEFAKEVLEHYNSLKSMNIMEADEEQTTADSLAVQLPTYNKALIVKALSEMIATQFYDTGTMSSPVEKTPVEMYNREAGVTTTEVAEGGQIKTGNTQYATVTIEAVGYKLRSVLTAEAIEDSQNAGNVNIIARAVANLAKDIAEELDEKLMALMVNGAAAGNVNASRASLTAKDYGALIVEGIVDAIQLVKKQNYRPDFMLVDPVVFGFLCKTDEFTNADKYGSDVMNQTGAMGKIRGLVVFESNNAVASTIVIGKRTTFGVYKVYIPTTLRGPVYDPILDKETYVIRQRAAMKVVVGEALATVKLTA